MTHAELKLLLPLLVYSSQELSNHGCNDWPVTNSPAALSLWTKIMQWSDPDDECEWTLIDTRKNELLFMDFQLIDYLIHCINENQVGN